MGDHKVSKVEDSAQMQAFMKMILTDVQAIEYMIGHGWFEDDIVRIGAEQEMVLIGKDNMLPATVAVEALKKMEGYPWVESELAQFNLETNLEPREFTGTCLSDMERENLEKIKIIRRELDDFGVAPLLVGILPTLRKSDVEEHNLMPLVRYKSLMDGIRAQMSKERVELSLEGIDELKISHNSPLLEACNTSFQIHLQVHPGNFVEMYNIAQTLAGPVMASAANSPMVFGRRLWHENRIALFQQALDGRASHNHLREQSPRVQFGKDWIHHSILDIYKDDIARFRILLSAEVKENAMDKIARGEVPKLKALQVHNGTIYRWNRPCYGISPNGKPHLRIENRVLPAGPTVRDEIANTALWLGAMIGMHRRYGDIRQHIGFADVMDNFKKAAKFGIDSRFNWIGDRKLSAGKLITEELLEIAAEGLAHQGVVQADIDTYLGVIEERNKSNSSGARWLLRNYTNFLNQTTQDEALVALTANYLKFQEKELPIHQWPEPPFEHFSGYNPAQKTVSEFMSTDLFTVREDDIIELVAEMMNWRQIRYLPVENDKRELIGLVSSRTLIEYFTRRESHTIDKTITVKDVMISNVITAHENLNIIDAMDLMKKNKIGCLPIIKNKKLSGIITAMDLLEISGKCMRRMHKEKG